MELQDDALLNPWPALINYSIISHVRRLFVVAVNSPQCRRYTELREVLILLH